MSERGTRTFYLASGPGYVAAAAAERGASVTGVDVAKEAMVSLARGLNPGIEFLQADVHELPFDDASFDAVVANFLILHLGRPDAAAAEFARVLRTGGRLALTAWDLPERARFLGVFLDAVAEAGATPPEDIPTGPDFFRFSIDEELDALLREQGLDDRSVTTVAFTDSGRQPTSSGTACSVDGPDLGALIQRQSEEVQQRIRAAFDRLVEPYRRGDGLELPVSAKLAAGRRH